MKAPNVNDLNEGGLVVFILSTPPVVYPTDLVSHNQHPPRQFITNTALTLRIENAHAVCLVFVLIFAIEG